MRNEHTSLSGKDVATLLSFASDDDDGLISGYNSIKSDLRTLDLGPCDFHSSIASKDLVLRLPQTMKMLHIKWAYTCSYAPTLERLAGLIQFLEQFTYEATSRFPLLVQVTIVDLPALAGWVPLPAEITRLQHIYASNGMNFSIKYEEFFGRPPLETRDFTSEESDWLLVEKTETFKCCLPSWFEQGCYFLVQK